jgi:hypothetical protein
MKTLEELHVELGEAQMEFMGHGGEQLLEEVRRLEREIAAEKTTAPTDFGLTPDDVLEMTCDNPAAARQLVDLLMASIRELQADKEVAFYRGAAVAFGLMGMAHAIREDRFCVLCNSEMGYSAGWGPDLCRQCEIHL